MIDLILILDAAAILTCYHCFRVMSHGRKVITGDLVPVMDRSELYAEQTDWRR